MSIFSRIGEIINANISTMLDKAEDPAKMIRVMIHEMEDTLTEVKSSAAEVIAERIRTARQLKELQNNQVEWEQRAELAVAKGRDDLARVALERKLSYAKEIEKGQAALTQMEELVNQYQVDITRLEEKLQSAHRRQKELLARQKKAETSRKVEGQIYQAAKSGAFERFEAYAERLDRMEAETEVDRFGASSDLEKQFKELEDDGQVEAELEKLKKSTKKQTGQK